MTEHRRSALIELALVLALLIGLKSTLSGLDLGFFNPGAIAVLGSLVLIFFLQRRNGGGFLGLGLGKPDSWKRFIVTAVVLFVLVALIGILGIPWLQKLLGDQSKSLNPASFPLVLVWIRIMVTAAFGEEVIFRGFMIPRFEALLPTSRLAIAVAVALQAVVFGALHFSSGPVTVISAGLIGLVFGIGFVAGGRSLWPLILVHAIPDTISLVQG